MRKKISPPKKINSEIEKYPMVSVEWFDIVSDSSWTSFDALKKSNLATCITKGHLLSQSKGVTRLFGDYSFAENGKDIESIGNTTIIPNSVIKERVRPSRRDVLNCTDRCPCSLILVHLNLVSRSRSRITGQRSSNSW
jgi:hypothetical protein